MNASFREVFRFEVVYLLRRPTTWIYLVALALLSYYTTSGMLLQEAQRGDLHINAPIGLATATVMVSLFGLLITASMAGDAATRDIAARMHPLVYSSPLQTGAYLGGRFLGVFAVNAALLLVVPVVMWASIATSDFDATLVGSFRPSAYLQAYGFFALPNTFVSCALLFTAALLARRTIASYMAGAGLFVLMIVGEEGLAETVGAGRAGALVDPLGFAALSELWTLWTPFEKNTQLVGLAEMLLPNRLAWLFLGGLTLVLAYRLFRFEHVAASGSLRGRNVRVVERDVERIPGSSLTHAMITKSSTVPAVSRAWGSVTQIQQALEFARRGLRDIIFTKTFPIVIVVLIGLLWTVSGGSLIDYLATPMWPTSSLLAQVLGNSVLQLAVSVIVAVYTGELVWKERDARLSEIADAAPYPDWTPLVGKALAMLGVVMTLQLVLLLSAIALQLVGGVSTIDLGLYFRVLFGLQLVDYALFIALALFVHTLLDHKQLGHFIVVICLAFTTFAAMLGVTNKLVVYGGDPGWVYSALSGFGPFLERVFWFKLYWVGWGVLLALAASLFQVRGRNDDSRRRARRARQGVRRPVAAVAALAALLVLTTGGFVHYNTNILNENHSRDERLAQLAEYERSWGRYASTPQPTLTAMSLHVEIWPDERRVDVRGTYQLANETNADIDTVVVYANPDVVLGDVAFAGGARQVRAEPLFGSYLYALATPLAPGDSLSLKFSVRFEPRGFPAGEINTSVVRNGTYFDHTGGREPNHRRWLPVLGYQSSLALSEDRERAAQGLRPAINTPSPTDSAALHDPRGRETIGFEAVIGTSAEQTAVATGRLQREWTENGRRYFHYVAERPIRNSLAFFSAEYAVHEATWDSVKIQIFHHPRHDYNLERMTRSISTSLAYFSEHFGPYPFSQLRVAEYPRYATLARAYPGTISYAEAFGFLTHVDEERDIDTPFMVLAHEVAHQWWGQQIVPANVAGAPMLTEVLAQYSAMMVTEQAYGPDMIRRFLSLQRIEYLNRRHGAENREEPLLLTDENRNVVYRKGSLMMYALREYLGESRLNGALRVFLETHGDEGAPYPTSLDLYREIRRVTPDSLKSLVADFFERTVIWDFRVEDVRTEQTDDGTWRVTLDFTAGKFATDSLGAETEVAMDNPVEIGVYADDAESGETGAPLYRAFHRVRSGSQSITVTVPRQPASAGVDPRNLLLARQIQGNVRKVRQ